jgi:predicted nucleic acid-binding protein
MVLGHLLRSGDISADLVQDAHLAALAMENGLTLCSADSDFARFPGLRWENPLRNIRA